MRDCLRLQVSIEAPDGENACADAENEGHRNQDPCSEECYRF